MSSTPAAPDKAEQRSVLPPIPAKRYFTIGEVSELCGVKPHVLRYWEQEFTQLRPMKRRGNRRYYQHHEVLLVRRIRDLLYEQGFTISGARNRLGEAPSVRRRESTADEAVELAGADALAQGTAPVPAMALDVETAGQIRLELEAVLALLSPTEGEIDAEA